MIILQGVKRPVACYKEYRNTRLPLAAWLAGHFHFGSFEGVISEIQQIISTVHRTSRGNITGNSIISENSGIKSHCIATFT